MTICTSKTTCLQSIFSKQNPTQQLYNILKRIYKYNLTKKATAESKKLYLHNKSEDNSYLQKSLIIIILQKYLKKTFDLGSTNLRIFKQWLSTPLTYIICIFYNSAVIIYGIYKMLRNKDISQQLAKQQIDQLKKLRNQNTNVLSPRNSASRLNQFPNSTNRPAPLMKQSPIKPSNLRETLKLKNIKKELLKNHTQNITSLPTILQQMDLSKDLLNQYDGL